YTRGRQVKVPCTVAHKREVHEIQIARAHRISFSNVISSKLQIHATKVRYKTRRINGSYPSRNSQNSPIFEATLRVSAAVERLPCSGSGSGVQEADDAWRPFQAPQPTFDLCPYGPIRQGSLPDPRSSISRSMVDLLPAVFAERWHNKNGIIPTKCRPHKRLE
ncbi:MAG: hypothetical protein Q9228_007290, partial [Teloschistes exilis]